MRTEKGKGSGTLIYSRELCSGTIVKLGLSEGDKLDIFEKDGSIRIMPVVAPPPYLLMFQAISQKASS